MLAITSKAPYAVRALTELARRDRATRCRSARSPRRATSRSSSSRACSPPCAAPASCTASAGVKGGYLFARPPAEITVLEVVELLEGDLGQDARQAGQVWLEAVGAVRGVLGATTIADVAERESERLADVLHLDERSYGEPYAL